ncbi:MAG TPA: NAD(P)-binding domain-containing protein, partial [Actinomycetota bacterium]|nr:NAD(P)-binding domain-containing protein [Actinomycetota bacterium]
MRIGMVGLGRMGGNMSVRLIRGGHEVVAFDPSPEARARVGAAGAVEAASLSELVAALEPPRTVWIMVPAGPITEQTLEQLGELLGSDDAVVDGGNSNWKDSQRHASVLAERGI